jgi:hypothetical protein
VERAIITYLWASRNADVDESTFCIGDHRVESLRTHRQPRGVHSRGGLARSLDLKARRWITPVPSAYVEQFSVDHPEVDPVVAAADAQLAVAAFTDDLFGTGETP